MARKAFAVVVEIKEPGRKQVTVDKVRCQTLAAYVRAELERIFSFSKTFPPG